MSLLYAMGIIIACHCASWVASRWIDEDRALAYAFAIAIGIVCAVAW